MRGSIWVVLAMAAALVLPALGQSVPSPKKDTGKGNPVLIPAHIPYKASYQETTTGTLNGLTLTDVAIIVEAYDSQGRQLQSKTYVPSQGSSITVSQILVQDPVERTDTQWNIVHPDEKQVGVATVRHWPVLNTAPACPPVAGLQVSTNPMTPAEALQDVYADKVHRAEKVHLAFEAVRAQARKMNQETRTAQRATKSTVEKLGVKTINGIETRGERITLLPVDPGEKDAPPESSHEIWSDSTPGLHHVEVLRTDEWPERKLKKELMTLILGEPDPSLFKVPPGFEIEDKNPPGCPAPSASRTKPAN